MIGKKINQLATELAPVSTDLTIIGDPISGVSKKITLAQLGSIFSGAVSFYTNLASFPATGDINVIYCAKDTQKLYLWSGSAYVEVFPSQALLDTYQLRSEKGNANGYASLDSLGKVPISQLPSSLMEYKGTWNASTNTPTLANGTGDTGDVYICNVAGTVNFGAGPITFAVGDYVIYSGTIWQRSSGAVGTVTSVAITESGDALTITGSPITTSGTINIGFAGTGAQYIKGDGTLATFPNTIDQAKNLITEVYNSTGSTLTKGTVVYINGGQGNLPTVTKALASGDSTSAQTYGIVQADITNNNNGFVVVAGRLADIDTQAFSVGTQLYLSSTTAGAYTSTKQYAPAHLVYVGIIVRSHPTQGIIEVKIQNGYELDELHNVAAQTPTNNDGLFWEASTSLWKNKSIATILGGTPITGSGNVNAIPKFTANSVLGNSVMEDDGNFVSMRSLKINAVGGVGETINFQQGSGITAAGLGYSSIGAASTTGFVFYIDQNTTSRSFILDTSTITSATQLTYSLPATSGTLALVSQLTGGTVTSVGLSSATSGVTIGSTPITTSGTITLAIATASGSQQGLLSSTDWTTFNNKQSALTNPVTGTGTTNYLPKFTGTSTIGNSAIYDNSGNIGINTTSAAEKLVVKVATNQNLEIRQASSLGAYNGIGLDALNDARNAVVDLVLRGTNLSLISSGATPMILATNDTERVRISSSGNVSIGNTNDTYKLDVTGTGRFSGAYGTGAGLTVSGTTYGTIATDRGASSASAGIGYFSVGSQKWFAGIYENSDNFGFYSVGLNGFPLILNYSTGAATFSSSVTSNGNTNGQIAISPSTNTNAAAFVASNAGGGCYFGKNNSTGGAFTGTAYATVVYSGGDVPMAFYTNDTERMRITSGGNVGIGTSSPSQNLHVASSGVSRMLIENTANQSTGAGIQMLVTSGGSVVGNGTIRTDNADNMQFFNAGGERMRITSGGELCVGKTSTTFGTVGHALLPNGQVSHVTDGNVSLFLNRLSSDGDIALFYRSSSSVGSISVTTSSTSFNTSSDYRLKQDLKDYSGLDLVSKIKTYDYEWKSDKSRAYGVIAHELQSVINYAVTGVKDGKEMQGVDYSKIVPVLIKAIQELNDKIK
jgi:hypothetical protein